MRVEKRGVEANWLDGGICSGATYAVAALGGVCCRSADDGLVSLIGDAFRCLAGTKR